MLSFGAEHRAATGLEAGDRMTLDLVRDEAERSVELADDFAAALTADAAAQEVFDGLSYSQKRGRLSPLSACLLATRLCQNRT